MWDKNTTYSEGAHILILQLLKEKCKGFLKTVMPNSNEKRKKVNWKIKKKVFWRGKGPNSKLHLWNLEWLDPHLLTGLSKSPQLFAVVVWAYKNTISTWGKCFWWLFTHIFIQSTRHNKLFSESFFPLFFTLYYWNSITYPCFLSGGFFCCCFLSCFFFLEYWNIVEEIENLCNDRKTK